MMLLTHVLHKAKARWTLGGGKKINHLFVNDLKLYENSDSEIKELVSIVEDFSVMWLFLIEEKLSQQTG